MDNPTALLHRIESEWPIQIHYGLAELIRLHPDAVFYAGSFWMLYCDYTVIAAPTFAVNAEGTLDDEQLRWYPPDWRWDVLDSVCNAMEPLYAELSRALAGASKAEWNAVMTANEVLIGRVSRHITHSVRSRTGAFADLALPANFVLFAGDIREDSATYNRQVRLSVEQPLLDELGLLAPEDSTQHD